MNYHSQTEINIATNYSFIPFKKHIILLSASVIVIYIPIKNNV